MNYPIQGLAIVGPIIFLVMAILTPVIGVFAGWKRAAYWGGGNFVIYFGGLASWKLAGTKITALLQPLIKKALESIKIDESKVADLAKSLVAPVFLLILFIVMNIILFICYYAFAKRCMRIGKFSPAKRLIRLENKIKKAKTAHKDQAVIAKLTTKKNKWEVRVQKTVNSVGNKKWFNRTIGGISFTVAMLPAVLTIPQVITMATTSKETRSKNKFASKIYDFLYKANDKLSFMYYYDTKTATDFDAGFGILEAYSKTLDDVTIIVKTEEGGKTVYKTETVSGKKLMDVIPDTLSLGVSAIVDANKQGTDIKESINTLSDSWNSIMEKGANQISSMFQSENVTALLEPVLESVVGTEGTKKLGHDDIQNMFGKGSQFQQMVEDYKKALEGEETGIRPLTSIPTTQKCVDNLTASFEKFVQPNTEDPYLTDEDKELFNTNFKELIGMFVYVA